MNEFDLLTTKSLIQDASLNQDAPRLLGIPSLNFPRPSVWPKYPIQDAPQDLTPACRLLTMCEVDLSGSTCSELLRVAWDFDSPWITGPMTPYQSWPYVRHSTLIPAANLCDSKCNCINKSNNVTPCISAGTSMGSAILFNVRVPVSPDDQRFHHVLWWK